MSTISNHSLDTQIHSGQKTLSKDEQAGNNQASQQELGTLEGLEQQKVGLDKQIHDKAGAKEAEHALKTDETDKTQLSDEAQETAQTQEISSLQNQSAGLQSQIASLQSQLSQLQGANTNSSTTPAATPSSGGSSGYAPSSGSSGYAPASPYSGSSGYSPYTAPGSGSNGYSPYGGSSGYSPYGSNGYSPYSPYGGSSGYAPQAGTTQQSPNQVLDSLAIAALMGSLESRLGGQPGAGQSAQQNSLQQLAQAYQSLGGNQSQQVSPQTKQLVDSVLGGGFGSQATNAQSMRPFVMGELVGSGALRAL